MLLRKVVVLLLIGSAVGSPGLVRASDSAIIDKSIFGYYLGEHVSSLNKRREELDLEAIAKREYESDESVLLYPISTSRIADYIMVT